MPNKKLIINLFLAVFIFCGQTFAKKDKGTLLTINNTPISKEEFTRIYEKNNKNLFDNTKKLSPKEYLELFINFKLKVFEAKSLGLDTVKTFVNELKGYRDDLASTYLTDNTYNKKMLDEMHRRMNLEVNASHILINLDKNALGDDTIQAYNKIESIRKQIVEDGADFGEMAVQHSQDPSAKKNKGKLGYFSAFQMVFPFENAAYSTPVGEISQPTRSAFGYHLVKVNDVRKAKGEMKVAHIMRGFPKKSTKEQRRMLKESIDTIYSLLMKGEDFGELAKRVSDDKRSAQIGGKLPWFNSASMISDFSNVAFALQNNGDISKPVMTSFGYHIIKRIDYKPIASFEDAKGEIEERIVRDPERTNQNKEVFLSKLKKEYSFEENKENLTHLFQKISEKDNTDANLFYLDSIPFQAQKFLDYLTENKIQFKPEDSKTKIQQHYSLWVEKEIINYEDNRLVEKYPDFRYLVKEYHDGILLFNLSEKKIWNHAATDTLGLEAFYNKNPKKYFWGERFKGLIIKCKNTEIRDKVDAYFDDQTPHQEILDVLNEKTELVSMEDGAWEQGSNPIVDYYVWNAENPSDLDEQLVYVRGDKVENEAKSLNEARGLYISDYQYQLEKDWIEELRNKYKIKVYKKVLKTIKEI